MRLVCKSVRANQQRELGDATTAATVVLQLRAPVHMVSNGRVAAAHACQVCGKRNSDIAYSGRSEYVCGSTQHALQSRCV
jgi:hypothetical protein